MRVLLSTSGSRGDVEPMVALAVRLRELGAEVRMCASPDSADRLAEAGVPLVPVGRSARSVMNGARPRPEDAPRLAAEAMAEQFETVPAAAEGCDAVVATGVLAAAVAVRSVAEAQGIPYFYGFYCPIFVPSPHYPPPPPLGEPSAADGAGNRELWDRNNRHALRRFGDPLNRRRAELGLPPVEDVFGYGFTDRPLLAADPVLAPLRPTDLAVVQTGAWITPDDRPLPADLTAFLEAGPPPVYVGFGSMRAPADAARVAVDAIRAQGCRVILSRGWAGLALPEDHADCIAVGEVNHQALFRRVAAVVHHGGVGTTTAAARAGAPQVVVPQLVDQPYLAGRVAALGIGAAHDGPTPTVESLSAALATALSPRTRERAAAVAGTIRADGATVAARLLLDVAESAVPA
ncbi:glycosyltransferase [Catenuloplanes atrovinosus]|uniref:UDP:flavonoid glycosyltransferase YjiC (YdhE family) n=1 Tax=Catenuloplanes atrovinosus TaxID=137266 RepID=A0AAE3YQV3_9ACTN|nr:glycosyltransferase [Catenuloplanes atrovinosus]MDR7276977.1 UDP:flavonoid glycosyltransferase YjiC (YdhE family) [Catenuloplanes atrovinosus]